MMESLKSLRDVQLNELHKYIVGGIKVIFN